MTHMTPDKLDQAREWAAKMIRAEHYTGNRGMIAAAEAITALPDEWIDANKLRELVEAWGQRFITSDADLLLRDLRALLPTPTPRTHPDRLVTEEDYRDAPVGTVVEDLLGRPEVAIKNWDGRWEDTGTPNKDWGDVTMAREGSSKVLRWGRGDVS